VNKDFGEIINAWAKRNMIDLVRLTVDFKQACRAFEVLFADMFPRGIAEGMEVSYEDVAEIYRDMTVNEAIVANLENTQGKDYMAAEDGVAMLRTGLKKQLKTRGDGKSALKRNAPQVTIFAVNGTALRALVYGKALRRKMRTHMRSNLLINPCAPMNEVAKIFNAWKKTGLTITDLDFERFDASIPTFLLLCFVILLITLGMPEDIVLEMMATSYNKKASDADGNTLTIYGEVCSGLWCTILGNGFVNYAAARLSGIVKTGDSGAYEGDDSHLLTKPIVGLGGKVTRCNANFGMICKLVSPEVEYFLGHFMIETDAGCVAVVDPMRAAEKFTSPRPLADAESIRASWRVNRATLNQGFDDDKLIYAISKKYQHKVTAYNIVDALRALD